MSSAAEYSFLDRLFHRVAFSSPAVQITAADVEKAMYGRRFLSIAVEAPVFITSLPRAGTTLVLEILARLPGVATHLYRDMPFVMAPLLWEQLSRSFREPSVLRERAHGDGMMVGFDSPEAFEEILWRAYWPKKFTRDRIALWSENEDAREFRDAFISHMKRIIAARSSSDAAQKRYVSKNNANIARISFLKRLVTDGVILVPFREPLAQAASLLRQHTRFLSRHREDTFGKQYMADIGHLEFGELHRPIAFEGIDEMCKQYKPESLDYWVAYWYHGFRHMLAHRDQVLFMSYEQLCGKGAPAVRVLADRLRLCADGPDLAMKEFHEPRGQSAAALSPDSRDLLKAAEGLHRSLLELSIV